MTVVIAATSLAHEEYGMKKLRTNQAEQETEWESTYALLARSEEKNRNLLEMTIYPLLIAAGLIAISQFAQQTMNIPATGIKPTGFVAACETKHAC
jgi:hypothetical protein